MDIKEVPTSQLAAFVVDFKLNYFMDIFTIRYGIYNLHNLHYI